MINPNSIARARYAAAFTKPSTAKEAAPNLGASHTTVLNQLYRYERRGLVVRVGTKQQKVRGQDPILWQWNFNAVTN